MTDHPVSPAAHPLPLMNPNNSTTEATGHSDEQQYMISLTNGAYCCDWLVDGVSRCGYKSIKGNVKRHIRVVHLSIRFVALLRRDIQPFTTCDRPFRCGVCSRTFSNKSALENHQSVQYVPPASSVSEVL